MSLSDKIADKISEKFPNVSFRGKIYLVRFVTLGSFWIFFFAAFVITKSLFVAKLVLILFVAIVIDVFMWERRQQCPYCGKNKLSKIWVYLYLPLVPLKCPYCGKEL